MSEGDRDEQKARARRQAEHRLIVQATMHAKRAGKLPARPDTTGSEIVTAVFVIASVIGLLVLVMRQGH